MRCEEWLDVSRLLYDITRGTSADNVDVISFGLVFEDNSLRNVFRIAAEKINLQIRVFFLKCLLERSHALIDNEAGVKNYLTFFLCSIDKNFLPVLRLHQGNPFNSGRKQISPEKNCARGNDHSQIRNDEHPSINPHLLSSHVSLRDANPTLIWLSRMKAPWHGAVWSGSFTSLSFRAPREKSFFDLETVGSSCTISSLLSHAAFHVIVLLLSF